MNIERVRFAGRLARRDPALLADYLRWFIEGRKLKPASTRQQQPDAVTMDQARSLLAERFGDWTDGPALGELRAHHLSDEARRGGTANMAGDSALGLLAYWTVRAARPQTVVETGVATGVTSAHVLAAIRDNGHGALRSIDLPPMDMITKRTVGAAIPESWKGNWDYRWGAAKRLLPTALQATPPMVFLHDSDHSYSHMTWELRTAWQALSPGAAILCDDTDFHSAFRDAAGTFGVTPHLVAQAEKRGTTGLLFR